MAEGGASRGFFAVLAALALVMLALLLRPFAKSLFVAAVLAAALHPLSRRLAALLRGRRGIAAGITTVGLVVVVLLPLGSLAAILIRQIAGGVNWLKLALRNAGVPGLVSELPESLRRVAEQALAQAPTTAEEIQTLVTEQFGSAAAALGGFVTATTGALVQLLLFLVAFFFFLADGQDLVRWLKEMVPLKRGQLAELLEDFRRVTSSVLFSTLATAGVQSLVALLGYLVARVPNPVFFWLVTFVMALVPVLGAGVVVVGLAALKFATGHEVAGVFLAIWAVAAVGMVDNVLKPILVKRGLDIHGAVVFFALLGGLLAFGPVGFLAGPLVVAFVVAVARMYHRDYGGAR